MNFAPKIFSLFRKASTFLCRLISLIVLRNERHLKTLRTRLCIIKRARAHTAAIYAARAELKPVLFEGGWQNIAAGGQLNHHHRRR
ncbi:hypothetical protein HPP92_015038 [Vanilla planifolia]|nr:hypothetical protein HPP92_015038 [Vanilla planifolia]